MVIEKEKIAAATLQFQKKGPTKNPKINKQGRTIIWNWRVILLVISTNFGLILFKNPSNTIFLRPWNTNTFFRNILEI